MPKNAERSAGILLPISALPSRYGIGCLSESAYRFVDFLRETGQHFWQILPIGVTGYGDSPYQSFSGFAGNPYFIDLEGLIADGLLSREACDAADLAGERGRIDYGRQYANRMPLLRQAYEAYRRYPSDAQREFEQENAAWLEDYACFMAYKESVGGLPLSAWDELVRMRDASTIERVKRELCEEIGFHKFLQYRFFRDWSRLKRYANERGIRIIGDLPIYVSADSVDLWTHPELFCLDESGRPSEVAGCPPDSFSPDGQLWGNPLYRWEEHRRTGYEWWLARFFHAFALYDALRVDHFRGFDAYYAIPTDAASAAQGEWKTGCGRELFDALRQRCEEFDGIAEDLGFVTDSVRRLVKDSGFAGTKVFQLAFDETEEGFASDYFPHRYEAHCVAYTGTHDNPTLRAWLQEMSAKKEARLRAYLCDRFTPRSSLCEPIIGALMRSAAARCIIPMQDYLELGEEGRINRPATASGNWQWRLSDGDLNGSIKEKIYRLTEIGGRLPTSAISD